MEDEKKRYKATDIKVEGPFDGWIIEEMTDDELEKEAAKQLSLEWGIKVAYIPNIEDFDELLNKGIDKFKALGLLEKGETVVLSGGATHSKEALSKQMLGGILKV